MSALDFAEALGSLPPEWPEDCSSAIRAAVAGSGRKIVVLDDDPTGTQTVHSIPVLTEWTVPALAAELTAPEPVFYLLTNSRSLALPRAKALNAEIGRNLVQASRRTGVGFAAVSRSDSTLRGHFPGEVEALAEALGVGFDAWLVVPFFEEGGRYTIGDVHFVREGDRLTPAGDTEFARDAVFGYRASNLRHWVQEKTRDAVPAECVGSISIEDLRQGGPHRVAELLLALPKGSVCAVNAASYRDLDVFVLGLLEVEAAGRRFLYRTAASFVRSRAGIAPRPLLAASELGVAGPSGGLVIVGSYVPKTTSQLQSLLGAGVASIEIGVEKLLSDFAGVEIAAAADRIAVLLRQGTDAVVYTSRRLVTGGDDAANLSIGRRISDALIDIVRRIGVRPRYLLAKGGITSSDVATAALCVKRALVLGQILPGVPVWRLGPECLFPELPYIVFPGNVGGADALREIVTQLKGEPQ